MSAKIYDIHDNGGRPFQVVVLNKHVCVYSLDEEKTIDNNHLIYHKQPFLDMEVERVFVGKSPKNKIGYDYGKELDGNSILLHVKDKEYIFVSSEVFSFTSPTEINYFTSPVGNNDVPYPWAKNEHEYFLFAEKIMVEINKIKFDFKYDIYCTFYEGKTPSKDMEIKMIHERL